MKISDHLSSNRAIDLELVDKLRHSNGQELGSLLGDSLVCLDIEEDGVVLLFLYLDLGPALLLGLGSTGLFTGESSSFSRFSLITLGILALVGFLGL